MDAPEMVLCQSHGQARSIADFLHENGKLISDTICLWEACAYHLMQISENLHMQLHYKDINIFENISLEVNISKQNYE